MSIHKQSSKNRENSVKALQLLSFIVGSFILAGSASAAPIPVRSFSKDADGVLFQMKPGVMKLQVCDARTVRVVYSPTEQIPPTKSIVITRAWQPVTFEVEGNAQTVIVSTGKLKA